MYYMEKTINEYNNRKDWIAGIRENRYINLACSLIGYTGLMPDVPASWVTECLIKYGRVVRLRGNGVKDGYYIGTPNGRLNRYGRPRQMTLTSGAGVDLPGLYSAFDEHGKALVAVELRANSNCFPVFHEIHETARQLAEIETAINVNIANACAADIIFAPDNPTKKAIIDAVQNRTCGAPAVVVVGNTDGLFEQGIKDPIRGTSTPYIADRLKDLAGRIDTDQLTRLGVLSSNDFKRERTQGAEVDASAARVIDWAYITIDQFNADAESAGLEERAYFTGAAEELYTGTPEDPEKQNEENGENENAIV